MLNGEEFFVCPEIREKYEKMYQTSPHKLEKIAEKSIEFFDVVCLAKKDSNLNNIAIGNFDKHFHSVRMILKKKYPNLSFGESSILLKYVVWEKLY